MWRKIVSLMNYDVWGYLSAKFKISPKRKFDLFFFSLIVIAFLIDFYLVNSTFLFFSYTLIFAISIMLNDKKFYDIIGLTLWELLLGIATIISSFTIVTPIKWIVAPNTHVFGVFNGGVFIIGVFIVFYGIKKYKIDLPFLLFYGVIITIHGTWSFILNDFAERYLSPLTANISYSILTSWGYNVTLRGTTISIIDINGNIQSATIAGSCSGIEGIILSTIMIIALLIGSKLSYIKRTLFVVLGALIMYFLNSLRIVFIFISAYYYGYEGLNLSHHWLGNIIFLVFILSYWYIIDKFFIKKRSAENESSPTG